jgi:hypothetical protein
MEQRGSREKAALTARVASTTLLGMRHSAMRRSKSWIVRASMLAAALVPQEAPLAARGPFEFPAGPIERALATLDLGVVAKRVPEDLGKPGEVPALAEDAWSSPATWSAWSAALARVLRAQSATETIEARARLALGAQAQGRGEDAWQHLEACVSDPAWIAAMLPRFLPGVPAHSPAGAGGLSGALPNGVVLTPTLPPRSRDVPDGHFDRRAMQVDGVRVGDATLSMRVSVENEGLQIDIKRLTGGSAAFSVRIPSVPGFPFASEAVDWYPQDQSGIAHALTLDDEHVERSLFARFEPRARELFQHVPEKLPAQLELGQLVLLVREEERSDPLLTALAAALRAEPLKLDCVLRARGAPAASWSGITVDLTKPEQRAQRIAWLASAVERFALGAR